MGYSINFSSGVYSRERNQAIRPSQIATSVCAAVFAANKGPVGVPFPVTDTDIFRDTYGTVDPTVSFAPYSVLEALKATNLVWCVRVADSALYGGVVVSKKTANQLLGPTPVATASTAVGSTLANGTYSYKISALDSYGESLAGTAGTAVVTSSPTIATLTTALTGNNNDIKFTAVTTGTTGNSNTITYVDPAANNASLSVVITPFAGYATVVVNLATNGGGTITTIASDILTALAAQGASFTNFMTAALATANDGTGVVTAMAVQNLAGGAATGANDGRVSLAWTAVSGATSYKVYGRTGGTELLMTTTTSLSYIDTGAVTPAGALPVANTTSDLKVSPFSVGNTDPATSYTFASGDMFIVYGANPGTWNNNIRVAINNVNTTSGQFDIELYNPNQTVPYETWSVSRSDLLDGFGRQLNMEERVNSLSSEIRVRNNAGDVQAVNYNYLTPVNMVGGDNGTTITESDIILGWEQFIDPEEVDVRILINGGFATPAVHLKMVDVATQRQDCIALLDVPSNDQSVTSALNYRQNTLNLDSSYGALFTSDQLIVDPINDKQLYVPPSGFVARAMAETDRNYNPWFAAAGMERGNVLSLGARHKYNQGQRDLLAKAQVNYFRTMRGKGIKIWEQFTLASAASPLQLINVRMLLIVIQGTIKEFLLYNVHEPNDAIMRARLASRLRQYLDTVVAGRGLYSYDVVCDETNNKPFDIDEGILNVDVYVQPVIPARRILLTTIITPTGVSFKESVLSQ